MIRCVLYISIYFTYPLLCKSLHNKGKVENVVKYVKHNFLYNRPFVDIDILNIQAMEWLSRTGNKMIHNTTRKVPAVQWEHEQPYLLAWHPVFPVSQEKGHKVLKTNVVKYKGNSYSLPFGTYRGEDSRVYVSESGDSLIIRNAEQQVVATHLIPLGSGHNIINTNHRRNTSIRLNELREKVRSFFRYSSSIDDFISTIERLYPRYVRDQLSVLLTSSEKAGLIQAEVALEFCICNNITSCNDFKAVLEKQEAGECEKIKTSVQSAEIKPLGDNTLRLISQVEPGRSDISEYETFFTNNKNNLPS